MNIAAIAQMIFGTAVPSLRGDLNDDNRVDLRDLLRLLQRRGEKTAENDPADLDHDRLIIVLDARKLALFCTRTGCTR